MTMPPWNMSFAFFLLDTRRFEDLIISLEEMLGGRFVEDLKSKADGRIRYTNYVFGIVISCSYEETWDDGRVYRMVGGNAAGYRFDTLETMDMSFHVLPLLGNVGCTRILTLEQFRDESRLRGLR
jgi:hypothetical protein